MFKSNTLWGAALLLLAGSVGVGGCATGQRGGDSPFDGTLEYIDIEVRNLNWSDATLWANRSGGRTRLGTVTGKGQDTFRISWNFSQPLYVEIDLLAGGRCATGELDVDPGDIIELEIPIQFNSGLGCSGIR